MKNLREGLSVDRIFNENSGEFYCIKDMVKFIKNKNFIEFFVTLNTDPMKIKKQTEKKIDLTISLKLELYQNDIFRLIMTLPDIFLNKKKNNCWDNFLLRNNSLKPAISIKVNENKDDIRIKGENTVVFIKKSPFYISLFDKKGKVIISQNVNDCDGWGSYINCPAGFKINNEKEICVFETIKAMPCEYIYGLGEKYTTLNRRGQRHISWAVDPIASNTSLMSYKNIPFFFSTNGYGIFINNTSKITYEFASESSISHSFLIEDENLDYFIIYGPEPKEIIKKYHLITGKPAIPPIWSFGLWMSRCMYQNRKEVEEVAERLRKEKIPCDVIHIDPLWLKGRKEYGVDSCYDLTWDEEAFPDHKNMIDKLKKMGFKLSLWENPYSIKGTETYNEGLKKGFFPKTKDRKVAYIERKSKHKIVPVDFSNPSAVKWYQDKHRKLFEEGIAVMKTDYGEWAPVKGIYHNGMTGRKMHNLYPLLYNKTVFEITKEIRKEGIVWGRSGYAGSQMYPVQWSGDSQCRFEDMPFVLRSGLSYGLSGVPFWSNDIGGFAGKPSPELYIRWFEFGLFCSHPRCHGTTPREPWEFGEKALKIFKKYVRLRYRLIPYIYSHAKMIQETSLPIIRAMVLEYPDDINCYDKDLQYFFGREILIAPVLDETEEKIIYFPEGTWIDLNSEKEIKGPVNLIYHARIDILPMFLRENSIVPYAEPVDYITQDNIKINEIQFYIKDKTFFILFLKNKKHKISAEKNGSILKITVPALNNDIKLKIFKFTAKKLIINGHENNSIIKIKNGTTIINIKTEKSAEVILKQK